MRWLLIALLLLAAPAHGRLVWENEQGFSLTTVGWVNQQYFPEWVGLKVKLAMPPNGYAVFEGTGALEFMIKGRWVADLGIVIADGCEPDPHTGMDTKGYHTLVITEEMECQQYRSVLMLVRLPHMFPTKECRPTAARWVGGYTDVEE